MRSGRSLQGLFDSRAEWWEEVKRRAKWFFMGAGKAKKARERRVLAGLQRRLNRYVALQQAGFGFQEELEEVSREMAARSEEGSRSVMFRCKEREIDEGETCSRYFFKKVMDRGSGMRGLKDEEGEVVRDIQGMLLGVVERFYSDLFGEKEVSEDRIEEVLQRVEGVVQDGTGLDALWSLKEVGAGVNTFKKGKAPGLDGLPLEFYQTFWRVVGPDLFQVFLEFQERKVMPHSFRVGAVSLLYKKGDREQLKNWRPISLLNFDLKVFTKVLTLRMRTVLADVIHPDQTCAVPGRKITDSLVLVRDAICFARDRGIRLGLLNLDFEKAYDRVSHQYLFRVLRKMGFQLGFLARVGLLHRGVQSRILVNGNLSKAVLVNCGVRRGCPLSHLLFICCMEPLLQVLRRDGLITGLAVQGSGGQEARCIAYMDDLTVVCTDRTTVDRTVDMTEWFGRASGARPNRDKCNLMTYGPWTEADLQGLTVTHRTDEVRILGVSFDSEGKGGGNWEGLLGKAEKKLQLWRLRQLSWVGKVLILKAVILPLFLYVGA